MKSIVILTSLLFISCNSTGVDTLQVAPDQGIVEIVENKIEGKKAILNFWAASCAFCRHELPLFEQAHNDFGSEVVILGVNMQEPIGLASTYWKKGGYSFGSFQDPNNELRRKYEVSIQPTTIYVSELGEVVDRKDGPMREKEFNSKLKNFLGNKQGSSVSSISSGPRSSVSSSNKSEQIVQQSIVPDVLSEFYKGKVKHTLYLDSIFSGGPKKDGIPAIDTPNFVSISDALYLDDEDVGIFLEVDGDSRFYPYAILNWHEIVNDSVGGKSVFVTYCPLCATGVVYGRTISAGETTFGVSGLLSQSNLLMYDRATESLWNQVTGKAVVGPLTSETLEFIQSDIISFKTVKAQYPNAKVLSSDTGYVRDYGSDPYDGYEQVDQILFPVQRQDDRLPSKELVYGLVIENQPKAYAVEDIVQSKLLVDTIGSTQIHVEYLDELEKVHIRNRTTGETIDTIPIYWFSWVAQYPNTKLFTP